MQSTHGKWIQVNRHQTSGGIININMNAHICTHAQVNPDISQRVVECQSKSGSNLYLRAYVTSAAISPTHNNF